MFLCPSKAGGRKGRDTRMIGTGWRWRLASLSIFALPLGSCLFETASPGTATEAPGADHRLDYLVSAAAGSKGCRVEITIRAWPGNEARIFQAPVFYADNPVMPAPGYKASDLTVTDGGGNALAARDTALAGVSLDGNFIVVPASARTISYAVDAAPGDSSRFGLPTPGTAKGVDLIDGAYFFILPLLGRDYPAQWRTPARISLEFAPIPGRTLVGVDARLSLATNYELMFVRAAYDPIRTRTFSMRNHEVTVYATSDGTLDLVAFGGLLEKCIRVAEDSLMPLPTYRYFAGENPEFWGIEGIQGYWFKAEARELAAVHVHEITHTFVGVYHSDHDDPWWKEGVAGYLGQLLALQAGLIGDSAFAGDILTLRDTLPAVREHALSDPYVRDHLFLAMDSAFAYPADPADFAGLVYGKGSQAAMILDRYILEGSGGKRSIYDLIRDLVRSYGTAFHRSDLEASVDRLAGGSSAAFLKGLLDQAAPLGLDSLKHTYAALRAMGRFAPGGGTSPISGIDPPGKTAAKARGKTISFPQGAKF
ncbi:MAG: hypothetical protein JWO30_4581 [Fibrobacteres bacterium]|nr:hypothetical protein [Fibrobacterota bacterium]